MPHDELMLLKTPSSQACEQATCLLTEQLAHLHPQWQPLRAPGALGHPAGDQRRVWVPLAGWAKASVPAVYEDIEGTGTYINTLDGWVTHPLPPVSNRVAIAGSLGLPDQWATDRNYHHAWYALSFDGPRLGEDHLFLLFDAVAHDCVVFVNGRETGRHVGGYTPFEFDITEHVHEGRNLLAVWVQDETAVFDLQSRRAISQLDYGRGVQNAHYAGIRGGVYFECRTPAHVSRIRVRTSTRRQQLTTQTWLRTGGDVDQITVTQTVHAWPEVDEPLLRLPPQTIPAAQIQSARPLENVIDWPDAAYWSPERPTLYVLRTTLCAGSQTETVETRFGFREFWIAGKEFVLNGIPVRLLGDGSHPRGPLLSLLPEQARDFDRVVYEFLKSEFHYHACRLHGIICPGWAVQAADEAGVLIVNQSGLTSGCGGAYEKAGEEFMSNMEQQFGEWYWRDVNNPSVVIWDTENELIRDRRTPEREQWVLRLDEFIRKHEPEAIIQHSGAGWYHPRQQVIHVHMQEHYSRIMRQWRDRETVPLVLGEFWMGGRGETRLPNSYEYHDREDWHREEARLYREKILEMRYYGVSGIMPHCLTKWPLQHLNPLWSPAEAAEAASRRYSWRFPSIRNEGGRGLAPVVVFAWPRTATVIANEPFTREVVVCNDRETPVSLSGVCCFGDAATSWDVTIDPGAQHRQPVTFNAGADGVHSELRMELHDLQGVRVAYDCIPIHTVRREQASFTPTTRQVVVVPAPDHATATALHELGVPFTVSSSLPADPARSLVIVPPDQPDDALGRTPRAVKDWLAADGRMLVLAQTRAPRWLPLGLPFWSAVRSSIPEFDRGGWDTTNKDLIYTREAPVYAPGHPVFKGLAPCDFKEWDPADGRIGDDAFIRPNALDMKADGVYRVLLGATRRENATLVESRIGAGTTLLCQAQVLRQSAHPAARALFCNLLRYLDGAAWQADLNTVGLLGALKPETLCALTGLSAESFVLLDGMETKPPALVLAGDKADPESIKHLAAHGAQVLVLSRETCGRLPGFLVESDPQAYYSATRHGVTDHPLFFGVAGASFLPLEHTPVSGVLKMIPDDARILLGGHARGHSPFGNDWTVDIGFYGLETREACPPLAASCKVGDGEIIATAFEPWDATKETHRQLLATLLANAGMNLPNTAGELAVVQVKPTVPLLFDGRLDDWTNDMDDINLSEYSHADPIALTAADRAAGTIACDLDYSALVYLLHDRQRLYLGGMVISRGAAGQVELTLDDRTLALDLEAGSLTIDGLPCKPVELVVGRQPAGDVIDTRLLNLTVVHKRIGKAEVMRDTPGTTFEAAIPWTALGMMQPPAAMAASLRLCRTDGATLQKPLQADGGTERIQLQFASRN